MMGTVKWYNQTKGYGFISPDSGGVDIFVHNSALKATGIITLYEGQKISFDSAKGQSGKIEAINLRLSQ